MRFLRAVLVLFGITILTLFVVKNLKRFKTVKFWVISNDYTDSQKKWFKEKAEIFEKETGIKIILKVIPQQKAHQTIRHNLFFNGDADVIQVEPSWIPEFASKGKLEELNLRRFGADSSFFNVNLKSCKYKDRYYGVPWIVTTKVLFYNKDIFKQIGAEPPESYNDLIKIGNKIIRRKGKGKAISIEGTTSWDFINNWAMILYANGGEIIDNSNKKIVFNKYEGVNAMQWYVDLIINGFASESCAQYSEIEVTNSFIEGNAAMCYMEPWNIIKIRKENSNFNFGIAEPPKGRKRKSSIANGYNLVISNNCNNKNAANAWISYLLKTENISDYSLNYTKYLPAKIEAFNNSYFDKEEWEILKSTLNNAVPYPQVNKWKEIKSSIDNSLRNTLTDYVNGDYDENTVQKYLDLAVEEIEDIRKNN